MTPGATVPTSCGPTSSGPTRSGGPPGGADRVAALAAAGGMIAIHVGLIPVYALAESGPDRVVMICLSLVATPLLLLLIGAVRTGLLPPARLPLALAAVITDAALVALIHLAVSGQVLHTAGVLLAVVGAGSLVRSGRWVAGLVGATLAGWVAVAATGRLGPPAGVVEYGATLAMAVLLSAVVFRVRADTERRAAAAAASLAAEIAGTRAAEQVLVESERRFRGLFTGSPVGIALADSHDLFVDVNDALCAIIDRPRSEILGRTARLFRHPEDVQPDIGTAFRGAGGLGAGATGAQRMERRFVRPDGSVGWAWLTITGWAGPHGEPWTIRYVQDVTERKTAEAALQDSEAGLVAIGEVLRAVQRGLDPRQVLVEQLQLLAGASTVTVVEREGDDLVITASRGSDVEGLHIPLAATTATTSVWRSGQTLFLADPADSPLVSPALAGLSGARSMLWQPILDGGAVTALLSVSWSHRVDSMSDRAARAVALLADEGARALREWHRRRQLEALALTDPLTGLPNRRSWDATLAAAMIESRRSARALTVALVDLDHFKAYNDEYGHPAGDRMLVEFAASATAAVRGSDVVARWGGEEFGVLLPGCGADAAHPVLDRVRATVPRGQHCSIGYTTWNGIDTVEALTAQADAALYRAKSSGRNALASY